VESVHLGTNKSRVKEAEAAVVKSVPALVMNGAAFHINFGAGIDALKNNRFILFTAPSSRGVSHGTPIFCRPMLRIRRGGRPTDVTAQRHPTRQPSSACGC